MKLLFLLFLLLLGTHGAQAGLHTLQYFYTASSQVPNFPEFVIVGMVDNVQTVYYDSITQEVVSKQDWMNRVTEVDPQYWKSQTGKAVGHQQWYKANVEILKERLNQTGGMHSFQKMYGCEWDEETGATAGFEQFGYDGEDFLALDLENLRYIAPVQQAFITKQNWDQDRAELEYQKYYYTKECVYWLKKYVDYGKSILKRTVPPSVSLLQKTPSSPITCHATGFYPRNVLMSWKKDGEDVYEDVEHGEVLHNEDGTFQSSVHLKVKPEDLDSGRYECVVQLLGVQEDFVTKLERSVVKTNYGNTGRTNPGSDSDSSVLIIVGAVIGVLLSIAIICGVVILMKKKKRGERENML